MPPKLKFTEGEKVLCFHGPIIYEAKALKAQITKDKQVKYLIHYAGWNKNWDEWVPESRVLKFNDANIAKQKEISKQHSIANKNKKQANKKRESAAVNSSSNKDSSDSRASTPSKEVVSGKDSNTKDITPASNKDVVPSSSRSARTSKPSTPIPTDQQPLTKKKAVETDTVESEDQFLSKIEVKIKVPEELKSWLVDDWDAITRQHKLVELPAKKTVQEIIDGYISYKKNSKSTNSNKESAVHDVALGIVEYFNVMLGSQLLYKFERPQYAEILKKNPDVPMAKIYGSFHLLRLFVKLGSLLAFTTLDEKSVQVLLGHIQDFLKYLVKHSQMLFNMTQYVNTPPEYHRI
uniref:Mortality factor 4-like protein 1 n=1 Tax=Culicoides sonorensis TaxID=179676 RepID=A0A336JXP7_CULSO